MSDQVLQSGGGEALEILSAQLPVARACCSNQTRAALLAPEVPQRERERRAALLARLDQQVAQRGPHQAKASARRAAQFIPYKSLVGLEELYQQEEERHRRAWEAQMPQAAGSEEPDPPEWEGRDALEPEPSEAWEWEAPNAWEWEAASLGE